MERSLAVAVSSAQVTRVEGVFFRHSSSRHRPLDGSASGGRWGAQGAYPVLYLARPEGSVVVEAYRHLVEPVEGMKPSMVAARRLVACEVNLTKVLDLRNAKNRELVGLDISRMTSDVGDYGSCHRVGRAAHQLGLHGVVAPAATGLGETLALFERHLPANEQPVLLREERWDGLPPDPRIRPASLGVEAQSLRDDE